MKHSFQDKSRIAFALLVWLSVLVLAIQPVAARDKPNSPSELWPTKWLLAPEQFDRMVA